MSFTEKWDRAFESRDRDALSELLDDDFVFVRHQSGKEMSKEEMLNMWTSDGPRVVHKNYRVIYENEDIQPGELRCPRGARCGPSGRVLRRGGQGRQGGHTP